MWWTKGSYIPALAATGTPEVPFTTILFGDTRVNEDSRSGFQITFGAWLDSCRQWGLEGDYWDLSGDTDSYDTGFSPGVPVISRPFTDYTDPLNPTPQAEITALPGVSAGMVHVDTSSYLQSVGVRLRYKLCESCCSIDPCTKRSVQWDVIGGYRYYRLTDRVYIHEQLVGTEVGTGVKFDLVDDFGSSNQFNGGELGVLARMERGRWSLGIQAKAALGNNHERVTILGRTIRTMGSQVDMDLGALPAQRTNIGVYERDRLAFLPQLGAEVGYQWNCHFRTYVGYDILYWDRVVRAGEQIDLRIDTNNLPFPPPNTPAGGPYPGFAWHEASFWAQGLRIGAELVF